MAKEDLNDYVEIASQLSHVVCKVFLEHLDESILALRLFPNTVNSFNIFVMHTKSVLSSNGQASITNSIVLIPIAANAINELNDIS